MHGRLVEREERRWKRRVAVIRRRFRRRKHTRFSCSSKVCRFSKIRQKFFNKCLGSVTLRRDPLFCSPFHRKFHRQIFTPFRQSTPAQSARIMLATTTRRTFALGGLRRVREILSLFSFFFSSLCFYCPWKTITQRKSPGNRIFGSLCGFFFSLREERERERV